MTVMNDKTLVERLRDILPLLKDLETGQDCAEYAFAKGDGFQAMTYCPDAFEALRVLPEAIDTIKAMQSRIEALEAEKLKSLALQDLAYQNGAQQYAAMAAQSPEAAAKWLQNLSRRSDGLRVLNDAKQALESQP